MLKAACLISSFLLASISPVHSDEFDFELSQESNSPFLSRGTPLKDQKAKSAEATKRLQRLNSAIKEYPSARECLADEVRLIPIWAGEEPQKFKHQEELEVCIFRIAAAISDVEKTSDFLIGSGFTNPFLLKKHENTMRFFGSKGNGTALSVSWSFVDNQNIYSLGWYRNLLLIGFQMTITSDQDNKPRNIRIVEKTFYNDS